MRADDVGSIQLDGRSYAWRSLGDGPPLLLLNGYSATAADWDPGFLAALAATFQVVCPDHRGMGDSELGDPAAVTVDTMADDVAALLGALALDPVAVAGWSMGGFVAQRLVERDPSRVQALALLATDAGGSSAVRAEPQAWARLVDRTGTPREQANRIISLLFPPALAPEIDRRFGDVVADARAALDPAALDAQERAMDAWYAREQPPPATAPPVLVLCGTDDVVIPAANAELLAARWTTSAVERVAGAGHAFMAQEPDRVAAALATLARS